MKRTKLHWIHDPECYQAGLLAATKVMIDLAPAGFKKEIFIANLILQVLHPQLPMTEDRAQDHKNE